MSELKKGFHKLTPAESMAVDASKQIQETEATSLPSPEVGPSGLKRGMIPVPEEMVDVAERVMQAEIVSNHILAGGTVLASLFIDQNGCQKFYLGDSLIPFTLPVCYDPASVAENYEPAIESQAEVLTTDVRVVEQSAEVEVQSGEAEKVAIANMIKDLECQKKQNEHEESTKRQHEESDKKIKTEEETLVIEEDGTVISLPEYGVTIRPVEKVRYYTDDGEERECLYIFEVFTVCSRRKISVASEKLSQLEWLNKAVDGLLYLDSKETEKVKKSLISTLQKSDIREIRKYDSGGWKKIGDRLRYVLANGLVGDTDYPVISDEKYVFPPQVERAEAEIFLYILDMFSICKNPAIMPTLILYVQMCFMSTIFSIAGAAIKFIVSLIGETNSRKTSLAMLLAKIFASEEQQPDATFTATLGGIEKAAYNCCDCCMVLDDMKPGTTKAKNKEMGEKLELITRIFGDRTPKKRMTGYGSDVKVSVGGGCIVTGEYIEGVESSRTRRVDVYIDRNEIDNERLALFQDIAFWPTYIYNFLTYVTYHAPQIIKQIKQQFAVLRKKGKFNVDRRNDQYAQLCISADLFLSYGVNCGAITKEQAEQMYRQIETEICSVLDENEKEVKAVSNLSVMLRSFCDYAQEHAEPIDFYGKDANKIYQSAEYFFTSIKKLHEIATRYTKKMGLDIMFPSEKMIPKLLEREGLIVVKREGEKIRRTLHLPNYTTGIRVLWISKAKLEAWIQQMESEDCQI